MSREDSSPEWTGSYGMSSLQMSLLYPALTRSCIIASPGAFPPLNSPAQDFMLPVGICLFLQGPALIHCFPKLLIMP